VRRLLRVTLKAGLWGFVALWVAYTVAYFKLNDAALGEFITRKVGAVERGQFILKRAHFPYWRGLASIVIPHVAAPAVGEDFTLLDPDGNPVIKVPVAYADVHIQELLVSLAKTALTAGHHFYLTLHFPNAYIPSGWAVVAPTRSTWGTAHPDVNIVAAMSSRKKSESTGGAVVIRVDEVELGDVGFGMGFSGLDGKPTWWSKLDGVHAKAGLMYDSDKELADATGPYFFFRLWDVNSPVAALQLGEYKFPIEGLTAAEFGVHGKKRQDLFFAAAGRTFGAGVQAHGRLIDAYSERPGVELHLDVVDGRGPLALLRAPLSVVVALLTAAKDRPCVGGTATYERSQQARQCRIEGHRLTSSRYDRRDATASTHREVHDRLSLLKRKCAPMLRCAMPIRVRPKEPEAWRRGGSTL